MGIFNWLFGKNKNDKNLPPYKSQSDNLSGDQKMVFVIYPKLKGIDFSNVKFGVSGNSPAEYFASDIDGAWYYTSAQMTMLFKAFSKKEIEKELVILLNHNGIKLEDVQLFNQCHPHDLRLKKRREAGDRLPVFIFVKKGPAMRHMIELRVSRGWAHHAHECERFRSKDAQGHWN